MHVKSISDNVGNSSGAKVSGAFYFDNSAPVITINPSGNSSYTRSINVSITISDTGGSGLSSSNSYQYYLSTSSTSQTGGRWQNYTNGKSFTVSGLTGKYYLHVKSVSDNAGNTSGSKVSSVFYFDNTAPVIKLAQTNTTSREYEKTFTINVYDNESGIAVKKYAKGNQSISYFQKNGSSLNSTSIKTSYQIFYDTINRKDLTQPIIYTVYAKNNVGLESVQTITIKNLLILYKTTANNGLEVQEGEIGSNGSIIINPANDHSRQFAPYCGLGPGTYNVEYSGNNLNQSNVSFDVCYNTGGTIMQTWGPSDNSTQADFNFTLSTKRNDIEIRCLAEHDATKPKITVYSMTLKQTN